MGTLPGPIQVLSGGDDRLVVRLPYTPERIEKMRTLPGRRWHALERYWSVPRTPEMPAALLKLFAGDEVELEEGLAPSLECRILAAARTRGLSPRTASAYAAWALRFRAQAGEFSESKTALFLDGLSGHSASTRNQALHALVFLYEEVLHQPLARPARSKMPVRLPGVLSREESGLLLGSMAGATRLMAMLLYGSGLRLRECCQLRVKDIDWRENRILVHGRATPLPASAESSLRRHLEGVKRTHLEDLAQGCGGVAVPEELAADYPDASRQWGFQWVFPAPGRYYHAPSRQWRRHHIHETVLQKAVREARLRAGILTPASCRTLRQSFAAHLLDAGYDIRTVQELMGHRCVESTMAYDRKAAREARSPADGEGGGGEGKLYG
ncbi:MAG: tyrosine-type recombinase/integrase [Elusimicrobia bacterium]|nr:tyrosine-type recombinase/integrase [Elusimicrobiota bacterium]